MNKRLSALAAVAASVCLAVFHCGTQTTAGNGSHTGNPVTAMLYNPGGTPAAHIKVRFYPIHYNPRTGGLAKKLATSVDSTTTDAAGNYTAKLDTGAYNVLAASDSGVVYQDSITVGKDSTIHPPSDTLKAPGGLRGRVRLQPGDDARTVFILFMGTNTWGIPDDSIGNFTVRGLAEGTYRVRILSWLDAYVPKDTVLSVTAGKIDLLPHDIVLKYTGIVGPTGLKITYDTLRQTVVLAWGAVDTSLISGYNVYRAIKGQNFGLITQTPLPDTVTTYHDSTVSVGNTYAYRVVSWMASGEESRKVNNPGDTVKAVSSSLVTTTFTWNFDNTIGDTASINDTIKVCLSYSNPTRKVEKIVWYADSLNSPSVKQTVGSSLSGTDTLVYWYRQTGNKKIFVKAIDGAGIVWTDSVGVIIIQDVPTVIISGNATAAINTSVTFTAQTAQRFGRIIRYRWDNGMAPGYDDSTGAVYSLKYLTEGTFTVKVEVMDDDSNINEATKIITITNDKPVITGLKDTTISINDSVVFTVNATDSNGIVQKYFWNFGDGSYKVLDTTNVNTVGHKFPATAMQCSVSVAVADSFGKQGVKRALVSVLQDAPVANAGKDTTVSINDTVHLHGSASQKFGTIIEWAWDIGNTGTFIITCKGDTNIIAPKLENRNFYCVLRVKDDDGNSAEDTVKITVVQDAPVANAGRDTLIHMGTYYTLHGQATQQFGSIVKWEWNIGGAGFKVTSSSDTTIPAPEISKQPLLCILRVTDDDGNSGIDTMILTAGTWGLVGAGGFSDGLAPYFSIAVNNGIPYVAFQDRGNQDKATVMRYNGAAWEPVGAKGLSDGASIYQSLAIANGVPYVAFCDVQNGYNTTVMRYSGTAWEPVGAKGFSDGCGYAQFLAIDNGAPYVTFRDAGNGGKISVMRNNGTAWEPIGASGFSDGVSSFQSLAIDNGTPYVAFCDIENGYKTTAMRYNGTAWEPVGAKGFSDGTASFQSIAVDSGVPFVAFQDGANGKRTTVMRYNGTAWEAVGVKGFSDGAASFQSFAIDNGNPFVAFIDVVNGNRPTVMRYDGTAWKPVGKKWVSDNSSDFLSLAVDKGIIYVAIQSSDGRVEVMKFW